MAKKGLKKRFDVPECYQEQALTEFDAFLTARRVLILNLLKCAIFP